MPMDITEFNAMYPDYFRSQHGRPVGNLMTELEPKWTSGDLIETLKVAVAVPLPSHAQTIELHQNKFGWIFWHELPEHFRNKPTEVYDLCWYCFVRVLFDRCAVLKIIELGQTTERQPWPVGPGLSD